VDVDNTISRERYEELVEQMRGNMSAAIDGRRKYKLEMEDEKGEITDEPESSTSES
jgi:hypothetical protein